MKVYEKLLKVQTNLKVPKEQYNSFGGYSYRNCEDILEALKPHLEAVGAVVNLTDEVTQIGGRFYIKAKAFFIDIESGELVQVQALAREEESKKGMDGSQVTGAASSYARKYALNGLFAIDDIKDSDVTNTHGKTLQNPLAQATKQQTTTNSSVKPQTTQKTTKNEPKPICSQCQVEVTDNVAKYSKDKFGKILCVKCQKG